MMLAVIFLVGTAVVLADGLVTERKQYTTKYDNINIDDVIKNDRLLKNYVDCLLDKGACTPDALELKKNMPDAIETDCSKCSEKQKDGSDKMIRYLIDNKPEYWKPLQDKYDPNGSYKKRYLASKNEVNVAPVKA